MKTWPATLLRINGKLIVGFGAASGSPMLPSLFSGDAGSTAMAA